MPFKTIRPEDRPPIDPLVQALTLAQANQDIADYRTLLDSRAPEQAVHEFLAAHSYFFNGILRLFGVCPLYSKVRLGSEYEVDFAGFDTGSVGPEWYLIEIEPPSQRLFTKGGDPSAALTHAMRQARDWQTWINDNSSYARTLLPHIVSPLAYIFLGRRCELPSERRHLRALNIEHRMTMKIHSLDWFTSAALGVLNLLESYGHGSWALPMRALTHADLARGLTRHAKEYVDSFFRFPYSRYPDDFLKDRESKHLGHDEAEEVV